MHKAVNTTEFWKERLDKAKTTKLHYSVYEIHDAGMKQILDSHLKNLEPYFDMKVLDAGCGYGRMAPYFKDYTGVDFSPDFIDKAKELYGDKFIVGDLTKLPFKDEEFEVAFCISIRQMIEANVGHKEWMKMQKELKRVAKKLLILEYGSPEDCVEI